MTLADNILGKPPTCLEGFECTTRHQRLAGDDLFLEYDLKCRACSGALFQVQGFPKTAPNPSPYFGVEPGQQFYRPPHRLRCVGCTSIAPVFDARVDGYDGALSHPVAYESGEGEDSTLPGQFTIHVSLVYHCLEELAEIEQEAGIQMRNLFGWVTIFGSPQEDGEALELTYECA